VVTGSGIVRFYEGKSELLGHKPEKSIDPAMLVIGCQKLVARAEA